MMKPCVIIPARMDSTRLPKKMLKDINGTTMIMRTHDQAIKANIGPVYVACDHIDIYDEVTNNGGNAIMTNANHESGSDRIYEAISIIDPTNVYDVVINLQGDMPLVDPTTLHEVLRPLADRRVDISTVVHEITDQDELTDPSVVKVAAALYNNTGRAIYFSRSSIPHGGPFLHHQGIYAYQRNALTRFVSYKIGVLEQREKLEQLRALENGMRIDVTVTRNKTISVDTDTDLINVRKI